MIVIDRVNIIIFFCLIAVYSIYYYQFTDILSLYFKTRQIWSILQIFELKNAELTYF